MTDFFLSVKKERRLGSALCGAGSVCERGAGAAARARSDSSHHDISASSCACSRNSAPLLSLGEAAILLVTSFNSVVLDSSSSVKNNHKKHKT